MQFQSALVGGEFHPMANNDPSPSKAMSVESPMFVALFRLAVPALLGAILTYASSISSTQTKQSESIYAIQGSIATIVQQNTDYAARLGKVERAVEDNRRSIALQDSRLSVVEARHP